MGVIWGIQMETTVPKHKQETGIQIRVKANLDSNWRRVGARNRRRIRDVEWDYLRCADGMADGDTHAHDTAADPACLRLVRTTPYHGRHLRVHRRLLHNTSRLSSHVCAQEVLAARTARPRRSGGTRSPAGSVALVCAATLPQVR